MLCYLAEIPRNRILRTIRPLLHLPMLAAIPFLGTHGPAPLVAASALWVVSALILRSRLRRTLVDPAVIRAFEPLQAPNARATAKMREADLVPATGRGEFHPLGCASLPLGVLVAYAGRRVVLAALAS